jgi:hypothetical protein
MLWAFSLGVSRSRRKGIVWLRSLYRLEIELVWRLVLVMAC